MKKSTRTTGILVLIVLVAVGAWYIIHARKGEHVAEAPSSLPQTGQYTETESLYTVSVNYPTTTPLSTEANLAALQTMQGFIQTSVAQFKSESGIASATPESAPQSSAYPYSFRINYLISSSPNTVSYIFTTNEDTGGAHGNTFFNTFTFNTKTGKEVMLADLFKPGSDYLNELSQDTRANLTEGLQPYLNTDMLNDGTKPAEQSFQDFFLDNDDFVVLFPPYAVAPYAAGPQTVRIQRQTLSSVLLPEYQ